ncbi:MAG: hypothetical protein PHS33_09455 [Candidatus Omnitrophica bacterium]|nr:hypothetical protein [Candidatus Omnitrophota bacterium]
MKKVTTGLNNATITVSGEYGHFDFEKMLEHITIAIRNFSDEEKVKKIEFIIEKI